MNYIDYDCLLDTEKEAFQKNIYHLLTDEGKIEKYYPNFRKWYFSMFNRIFLSLDRKIYIAHDDTDDKNDCIAGVIILKRNKFENKICCLYVSEQYRYHDIGTELMRYGIKWLKDKHPLFSMDKELIEQYKPLITKFNFHLCEVCSNYYQKGRVECAYNKKLSKVLIMLPIKREYAQQIIKGTKKYEYRKSIPAEKPDYLYIYETAPTEKVIGCAHVADIIEGSPNEVWNKTYQDAGISYDKYYEYFKKSDKAYAYVIDKVVGFPVCKKLSHYGLKQSPQNFVYISKHSQ